MTLSRFTAVRSACVVVVASAIFLLLITPNASHEAASADLGTCSGDFVTRGSHEAPQRCDYSDSCRSHPDSCTIVKNSFYYLYVESVYVGDCESTPCPDTVRCEFCNGTVGCAIYKVYETPGDCMSDIDGTFGTEGKPDRCNGDTGS